MKKNLHGDPSTKSRGHNTSEITAKLTKWFGPVRNNLDEFLKKWDTEKVVVEQNIQKLRKLNPLVKPLKLYYQNIFQFFNNDLERIERFLDGVKSKIINHVLLLFCLWKRRFQAGTSFWISFLKGAMRKTLLQWFTGLLEAEKQPPVC